ncbi:uncharacterized protein LOC115214099 isoform X1 [Argonauta hians]
MDPPDQMDEMFLNSSYVSLKPITKNSLINKRSWRSYSEKLRRAKLNCYFEELARCVPLVANSPQRLNKTSILRLSLSYLKFLQGLKRKGLLPKGKSKPELLEPGHVEEIDVIGQSIYNFIHPNDTQLFQEQFHNSAMKEETWLIAILKPTIQPIYEEISIFAETMQMQYISKHDFNDRFLDITLSSLATETNFLAPDEWFEQLTGFNEKYILGKSAYLFVHEEDMEYVANAHKEMAEKNIITETVFRSMTKNNKIYYTCSRTCIIQDTWTQKPKMIVAVNDVISATKGKSMYINQLKNFSNTRHWPTENNLQDLGNICT